MSGFNVLTLKKVLKDKKVFKVYTLGTATICLYAKRVLMVVI